MTVSQLPVSERAYPGKGKVLRVKEGFNPNSSSLGSVVFCMSAALIAAPLVLNAAAAWIGSRAARRDDAASSSNAADRSDALAGSEVKEADE